MRETNNLHVADTMPLLTPLDLKRELSISAAESDVVATARERIRGILRGDDPRLLVVVGPCSIHDIAAAEEYGAKLAEARGRLKDRLEIVMRVYFEKPRTTTGWKGLINDPHLDGSFDINTGLRRARTLLLALTAAGLPAATEMLDPIAPQYLADLVSWTAIGARTTESQTHREMASGLSMPVGFKNGTDGSLQVAINAMESSRHPHRFLGINNQGVVSIVATTGNPDGHMVLRGGTRGPNYQVEFLAKAAEELRKAGLCPRVLVDCSHDNAAKDHANQPGVLDAVADQVRAGSADVLGVMIESNLTAGKQAIPKDLSTLVYGQSITDACVDFPTTISMLDNLAAAVSKGRQGRISQRLQSQI
jgi:3-deoxy-7-phosphoheptulonate synthase